MPEGASGKQQNAEGKCGRWPAKTLVGKSVRVVHSKMPEGKL